MHARRGSTWRARALAAATTVLLVATPACAQQRGRQDLTDQIARSVARSTGSVLVGRLTVSLRPGHLPGGRKPPPDMRQGTLAVFGVAIYPKVGRAALFGPPDAPPLVVYDPAVIYARRIVKSKADRRLWARLELDRLPDTSAPSFDDVMQGAQPGDAVAIGPVFLTDMLSGVLTGSVKQRKVDADGNRLITFNASISKANRQRHLNDDERKARQKLLHSLAIKDDIGPGEVVLRKDGSLSQARFVFAERPDKQTRLDLEAVLVVTPVDAPDVESFALPKRDTTVRIPAFGNLKAAVTAQFQQAAQLQQGAVAQQGTGG